MKYSFVNSTIGCCSVKRGGSNPVSDPAEAVVHVKAKELDVPKEIVEFNIMRASEKGQEDYIEKFYEDQPLAIALDAGAEDVIEPPDYLDESEEDEYERRMVAWFCGLQLASLGFLAFLILLKTFSAAEKGRGEVGSS
ncbi:hypothetical protein Ancab_039216 [Ancistrocladus abbreviatus]